MVRFIDLPDELVVVLVPCGEVTVSLRLLQVTSVVPPTETDDPVASGRGRVAEILTSGAFRIFIC